ncbi:MAG: hypothetical protein ACTSRG_25775 [Candidatus Helarchaeota archaeon]
MNEKERMDNARLKDIKCFIDTYQKLFDATLRNNIENFTFQNIKDPHRELSAEMEVRVLEEINNENNKNQKEKFNIIKFSRYIEYWNSVIADCCEKGLSLNKIFEKFSKILAEDGGPFSEKYLLPTKTRFNKWNGTSLPASNSDLADLIVLRSDEEAGINLPRFFPIDVKSKEIDKWKNSNGISSTRFLEWCEKYIEWFENKQKVPPTPIIYIEIRHKKEDRKYIAQNIAIREIRQMKISEKGSGKDGEIYPNPAQGQLQFSPGEHANRNLLETKKFINILSKRIIPIYQDKKKKIDTQILRWDILITKTK